MTTVLTALVAVTGTLLAAVLTSLLQRRTADRAEALALAKQLRQDRLQAYNQFTTAAIRCRQSEMDRWNRWSEDRNSTAFQQARMDTYRARDTLREALLGVRLVNSDPALHQLGQTVIDVTVRIHDATDMDGYVNRKAVATEAIDTFTAAAAGDVQAQVGRDGTLTAWSRAQLH